MSDAILVINAGSSSIKFAVFSRIAGNELCRLYSGVVDGIGGRANFAATSTQPEQRKNNKVTKDSLHAENHSQALQHILNWLEQETTGLQFVVAAHGVLPAEEYHQDYYIKNPIRYVFYRSGCGRDGRLEEVWGKK